MKPIRALLVAVLALLAHLPALAQSGITNGDFSQGLTGWTTTLIDGCGGTSSVNLIPQDPPNSQVLEVKKVNAGGCFGAAIIEQALNILVSSSAPLELRADVKAINASVASGCGFGGLEFPLAIQVGYLPPGGSQSFVKFAFHLGVARADWPQPTGRALPLLKLNSLQMNGTRSIPARC